MAEQIANLTYKPWMNINGNVVAAKQVISNSLSSEGNIVIGTEDGNINLQSPTGNINISALSLKLNGSPIIPGTGSGLNWLGDFNVGTNYQVDDAVANDGSSYICIQNSIGNYPDNYAYWNLMASQGEQGTQGNQGNQGQAGAQGQTGNQGSPGLSSSFFNYQINADPFEGNTPNGFLQFNLPVNDPAVDRMYINFIDGLGNDITPFLGFLNEGDQITIQLQSDSTQIKTFLINGPPVNEPTVLAVPVIQELTTTIFG